MNGTSALVTTVVVDTLLGFLLAWLYAALRPRLGPGAGTAVIAAFVVFGIANLQMATFAGWFRDGTCSPHRRAATRRARRRRARGGVDL